MNTIQDLERLVAAIEKQGANIAPTYQEYMPLAFAIANDCGEAGRSLFHRICRISEKYVSDEADRLFDHALKGGNGRNGIGSVYHWAETAGVKLDKQLAGTARSYAGKQPGTCELANLQPSHPLTHTCAHEAYINMPVFGNYDWPPFLNQLIDCGDSPAQRDILLLGAVTVLGATLNKHLRILYGRKYHYPCLQTFIVAPPASGKGALTWVRHLAEPIHEAMMEEFKSLRKEYRLEKARWGSLGKERAKTPEPEEPRPKMFLIAGDNSGTGVLENLIEADGVGLICETEADTVSTAIGTDYGHWSDTLRKCYDHDRLAFNRRMNHEYLECMKSFLSVLLSGTPAQVKPLIPSAENGLFSRQMFYYMPSITEWVNQFDLSDEDYDSRVHRMGQTVEDVHRVARRFRESHSAQAVRRAKNPFQRTFRTTFRPCGFHAWGSHEKHRGNVSPSTSAESKRGGPATSHGKTPPATQNNFQFSILHFQMPRSLPFR